MKEYLFVQKIKHKNGDLELDFLQSATLISKINSLAPRLVLKTLNPHNFLLEDMGLKTYDRLNVSLMDAASEDRGEKAVFIVIKLSADENPNILILECLEENAYWLSQKDCRVFNRRSMTNILKALAPKLKPVCGKFSDQNTYHLANQRRFNLIARMVKEQGAVFFLKRGQLLFKSKKDLLKQPDLLTYEYKNPDAEHQIERPRLINRDYRLEEDKHHYMGWHLEKGLVFSSKDKKRAPRMVNCDTKARLNNLSLTTTPALSFLSAGQGRLTLGSPLKLIWHSGLPDRPLDESYPRRVLIGQLVHHEQRGEKGVNFTTKVYGAL